MSSPSSPLSPPYLRSFSVGGGEETEIPPPVATTDDIWQLWQSHRKFFSTLGHPFCFTFPSILYPLHRVLLTKPPTRFDILRAVWIDTATITIQRHWRGYRARLRYRYFKDFMLWKRDADMAATRIQRAYRERLRLRQLVEREVCRQLMERRASAASVIQRMWLAWKARIVQEREELVATIRRLRDCAALTIQRHVRGALTRQLVDLHYTSWVVTWSWDSPHKTVELIGSFTKPPWRRRIQLRWNPILKQHVVALPRLPGRHEVKFVVDGDFCCDGSLTVVSDGSGHYNNLIFVSSALTESPVKIIRSRIMERRQHSSSMSLLPTPSPRAIEVSEDGQGGDERCIVQPNTSPASSPLFLSRDDADAVGGDDASRRSEGLKHHSKVCCDSFLFPLENGPSHDDRCSQVEEDNQTDLVPSSSSSASTAETRGGARSCLRDEDEDATNQSGSYITNRSTACDHELEVQDTKEEGSVSFGESPLDRRPSSAVPVPTQDPREGGVTQSLDRESGGGEAECQDGRAVDDASDAPTPAPSSSDSESPPSTSPRGDALFLLSKLMLTMTALVLSLHNRKEQHEAEATHDRTRGEAGASGAHHHHRCGNDCSTSTDPPTCHCRSFSSTTNDPTYDIRYALAVCHLLIVALLVLVAYLLSLMRTLLNHCCRP